MGQGYFARECASHASFRDAARSIVIFEQSSSERTARHPRESGDPGTLAVFVLKQGFRALRELLFFAEPKEK
jgi:hypothetical protein